MASFLLLHYACCLALSKNDKHNALNQTYVQFREASLYFLYIPLSVFFPHMKLSLQETNLLKIRDHIEQMKTLQLLIATLLGHIENSICLNKYQHQSQQSSHKHPSGL